ncbi:tail protein X [Helicobacter pullorum]
MLKEIESLKAQEAQLQEQIKELEEQIAQAGSADNEELESLKQSIAELEATKIQKEQELQNASVNLEALKAQYASLAEAINALNREIKALSDEIKAKEAEITTLRAEKTGLEEQIQENNSKYEALRVELESLQQEILALQNKLENAGTDTIKTLENLHTELLGIAEELGVILCATLDDKEEEEKPQIPTTEIVIPKDFKGFHYIAKDDERLDSIVYSHYGTLNVFQSVLETNSHLLNKKILNAGDIVLLPKINTSIKTLDDLWN